MSIPRLLTQTSGSTGQTVYSRNQHGPYTRDRTLPFDPATALQVAVRDALAACVTAWKTTLTEPERSGWDEFALAVRTRTALGRRTNAGGLGMYIRANVPRLQASVGGSPRVDQAPTLFDSAAPTPIVRVVLNFRHDTVHPFFTESDPWVTEDDAALLLYASPPQPLTRNFWAGPYRLAGTILGSSTTPPTSPGTLPLPLPATLNQRVFVRLRLTRADARLSPSVRLPADAVAQDRPLPVSATWNGGAPPTVDVLFDQLLRDETHSVTPWFVRHTNEAFSTTLALTDRDTIRLTLSTVGLDFGADEVNYTPPPRDLHSLLNGTLVRVFLGLPLT